MSNYLAIATVTAALQRTLQAAIQIDVDGARVTTVRPDAIGSGTPEAGVNLYLYHVAANLGMRNTDLPAYRARGEFNIKPHVALDLHYLLSCYGNEIELEPQRLLGSIVSTLHSRSTLTPEMIRDTVTDSNFAYLADSDLAEQLEQVKFLPTPLTTEELSKIWSVFFQTPYTLSVSYKGTVVLIETDEKRQRALPVRDRYFTARPNPPVIDKIVASNELTQIWQSSSTEQPIVATSNLSIRGKRLQGEITYVRVGEVEVQPPEVSDTQISLQLSELPIGALRAGVQSLQVIHLRAMASQPGTQRSIESNLAAFVLRPTISEVSVADVEGRGDELRSAVLTLSVNPRIGKAQRVVLMLNEISLDDPAGYTFKVSLREADSDSIAVAVSNVKAGEYLVRLQVDGAESLLNVDRDSENQYISPMVLIP